MPSILDYQWSAVFMTIPVIAAIEEISHPN